MAYFKLVGADMGVLANWRTTDTTGSYPDLGAAPRLPTINDTAFILTGNAPSSGSCDATTVMVNAYMGPPPTLNAGTFNGDVYASGGISGGIYNRSVYLTGGQQGPYPITGGTFNGDCYLPQYWAACGMTVNGRMSFDNGLTWVYGPSSPFVAPPHRVLYGTSNLGVPGTYTPPAGGGSSGPKPLFAAISDRF